MARARRFGETAVTARTQFHDGNRAAASQPAPQTAPEPSLSPRYAQRGVRCGEQILDDFVKMQVWYTGTWSSKKVGKQ
jgi:hypothetical protein